MSPDRNQRWSVTAAAVGDKDAADLLRRYFAEMTSRYLNRTARSDEIDAAMAEDPSHDLTPPGGLLLLAWFRVAQQAVLACDDVAHRSPRSPVCSSAPRSTRPGRRLPAPDRR